MKIDMISLHLHEIMEGLYFNAVCLGVCVSVCLCVYVSVPSTMARELNLKTVMINYEFHSCNTKMRVMIIPPRNRGGIIFSLQFVCVSVCLCVCLCVRNSCEQNSSRTDAPIWTWFSLNGCLPHWLEPY